MTGLIHSFCEPFNAQDVISKMISGARWPRPGYLLNVVGPEIVSELRQLHGSGALLLALTVHPRSEDAICSAAHELLRKNPHAKRVVDQISLSPRQIAEHWDNTRAIAAGQGMWMHWQFEAYLNRVPIPQACNGRIECTREVIQMTIFSTVVAMFF